MITIEGEIVGRRVRTSQKGVKSELVSILNRATGGASVQVVVDYDGHLRNPDGETVTVEVEPRPYAGKNGVIMGWLAVSPAKSANGKGVKV